MATKITLAQFEELNNNLIVDDNGHTNKKCPLCNKKVYVETDKNGYTLKCETKDCLALDFRGL